MATGRSFDLPNVIALQQKLIQDLSGNDLLMNTLAGKVGELQTAVSNANSDIVPTLTKQADVQAVLDQEEARLRDRKQAIDSAKDGQSRLVDLTRNATQRSRAINNMYIVAVVGLLLYLATRLLAGILPEKITDILTVLIFSFTVLFIIKMYGDYTRRNNMDYDMINLGEPSKMVGNASGKGSDKASGAGLIDTRLGGGCVKDACCPQGSKYNEKYAICVPNEVPYSAVAPNTAAGDYGYFMPGKQWKLKSSCTLGVDEYSFDELGCKKIESFTTVKTSDMAKANDPFEFENYNLYK
jgi:uncharacterized membrane protein